MRIRVYLVHSLGHSFADVAEVVARPTDLSTHGKLGGRGGEIGVRSIDRSDHHRVYVTIVENSLISAMILRRNIVAAKNCEYFFFFINFLIRRFLIKLLAYALTNVQQYDQVGQHWNRASE